MTMKTRPSRGTEDDGQTRTASESVTAPVSFDSELDALFAAAAATTAKPSRTSSGPSGGVQKDGRKRKASGPVAADKGGDVVDSDEEDGSAEEIDAQLGQQGEPSEGEDLELDDDDAEGEEDEVKLEDVSAGELDKDRSDSDLESDSALVHETLLSKDGQGAKSKSKHDDEPREIRDRRSIFIGNLPISLVKSRSGLKALKKLLVDQSPFPSVTQIQSVRLRSIPFSKPTDDYDARDPEEANKKMRRRQRAQAYKEAVHEAAGEAKKYLSGAQKRKVAFITQQINEKADSVNAYITLAPITDKLAAKLKEKNDHSKVDRLTAPVLAALLARSAHGTMFEERHLRVDLVSGLQASEVVESGLDTIKTADGSMLGAMAGGAGVDREGRQRTAFVGNMDFETRDEEVREFFNLLLTGERGAAPAVPKLDFSRCTALPTPERSVVESEEHERSWVQDVRIIRDAATQMGKGFGYVRFLDAACVDELMAIHESEEAFLAAAKAGKAAPPTTGQFRRKLKLKGRPLRISRCKVPKGHVTPAKRDKAENMTRTPRAGGKHAPEQRGRSTGAPTPGGTSPYAKKQKLNNGHSAESPTTKKGSSKTGDKGKGGLLANPPPKYSDPLKAAEVAQKKADPDRQARRMAKKNAKRTAQKLQSVAADVGTTGRVPLKQKAKANKKGPPKPAQRSLARRAIAGLALLGSMMTLLAMPASANNEISNFGPLMCPADETGHLQDKAARQISHEWPTLRPLSGPQLFSLLPDSQPDVWLALTLVPPDDDLSPAVDIFAASITPQQLSSRSFPLLSRGHEDEKSPRDRWLSRLPRLTSWYLWSKRFSFRVNWSANFPLRVTATVHSPQSMLAAGKARWQANGHEVAEDRRSRDEDIDSPQWPCPRVYIQLRVGDDAVHIPPKRLSKGHDEEPTSIERRAYNALVKLAEIYVGPLTNGDRPPPTVQADALPVPVHLVLEPLYLGFVPHTALGFLALLVPTIALAYVFVVPFVEKVLEKALLETESEESAEADRRKRQ